jgi:AraC-like DNA-binding protein
VGPREYALSGNDIFITFPDEAHSTGRRPEEKSILYWLIVDLSKGKAPFLGLVPEQSRELKKGLLSLKSRLFRGKAAVRNILDDLIARNLGPGNPLKGLQVRNKLVEFLLQVIYYGRKRAAPETLHPLKSVLECINSRLDQKLSVPELARLAGVSVSRFKAKFKRIMGMPPGEYILRKKVERAQELLSTGNATVTGVAFELDFSSSQYFATVFKRYTGKNPGAFLCRKKGAPA